MSYINVRKAKQYYKSHKNILDKKPAGVSMHFGSSVNNHTALEVGEKKKKVTILKGGLGK